jgi:hypothetical protein
MEKHVITQFYMHWRPYMHLHIYEILLIQNTLSLHFCFSKADIFMNSRVDQIYASNEMNQLQHETRMTTTGLYMVLLN